MKKDVVLGLTMICMTVIAFPVCDDSGSSDAVSNYVLIRNVTADDSTINNVTFGGTNYSDLTADGTLLINIVKGTYDCSWEYDSDTYSDEGIDISYCEGTFTIDINGDHSMSYCTDAGEQ